MTVPVNDRPGGAVRGPFRASSSSAPASSFHAIASDLRVGHLEHPLPEGAFDLVVSVLAIHHLNRVGNARLFQRIADVLAPAGRFVFGDFVVPEDPSDVVSDLDPDYDTPSTTDEQLQWPSEAGLPARVVRLHRDLAVVIGDRPST
jgi:tRNA (cmo5U34)-methyltransferase